MVPIMPQDDADGILQPEQQLPIDPQLLFRCVVASMGFCDSS
jgi:hypothetical protein